MKTAFNQSEASVLMVILHCGIVLYYPQAEVNLASPKGHREMEIFSYVVSGELEHKDSMGNVEVLRRGDIQHTSAGTGIRHSEYNKPGATTPVHFIQIWAMPNTQNLEPKYFARHFTDEEKTDKLVTVVAPVGDEGVVHEREAQGPAPVMSNLSLKATIISPGKSVEHVFPAPAEGTPARKGYIHVVQTSGYNTLQAKGNRKLLFFIYESACFNVTTPA